MKLTQVNIEEIQKLEEALWRSETRFDLDFQERVFAPDFFEFGRSGRIYSREEMISTEILAIQARLPLLNFKVRVLDETTVQTTYISEVQYAEIERANRSSIWSKTMHGWQLRFHQGTPIV